MVKKKHLFWILGVVLIIIGFWGYFDDSYHEVLPIEFSDANDPVVQVTINGESYPLAIDLGSKFFIKLDSNILERIPKENAGTGQWINAKGERYVQPKYKLKKVCLGKQVFHKIYAIEKSKEENCVFWQDLELCGNRIVPVGHIGRRLLKKRNLLIDYQKKQMILSNSSRRLKKDGYDLSQFHRVPFELTPKAIFLKVEIDQGFRSYILDTGSTLTLLKAQLYHAPVERVDMGLPLVKTEKFILNGKNYGPIDLHLMPIPDELTNLQGILGMDFLENHVIYLDFTHQVLYISP